MRKSTQCCVQLGVHRLTPLLLQAWNQAFMETSTWSVLGVGNGCLGLSPPDPLQTFLRANPGYGPCKRSPLLLTTLSDIRIFQHAIWSKLSNGNIVLKTPSGRMETSPATVCLSPVRCMTAGSIQFYQVGWKKVGGA